MNDRQAAEARELAAELAAALDDPKRGEWGGYPWEHLGDAERDVRVLLRGLDALSVRLAQAEQERDYWRERACGAFSEAEAANVAALDAEARLRVTDALKREYEEALKEGQRIYDELIATQRRKGYSGIHRQAELQMELDRWAYEVFAPGGRARAALAASRERSDTADAGGREAS